MLCPECDSVGRRNDGKTLYRRIFRIRLGIYGKRGGVLDIFYVAKRNVTALIVKHRKDKSGIKQRSRTILQRKRKLHFRTRF